MNKTIIKLGYYLEHHVSRMGKEKKDLEGERARVLQNTFYQGKIGERAWFSCRGGLLMPIATNDTKF